MTTSAGMAWPGPDGVWSSNDRALEMARAVLGSIDAPVGLTPKELIWRKNKARLYRYLRTEPATHQTPIFLVLPLINRAYILDLRPGASFVEFLLSRGFDVFLIDWGVPGDEDADMGIDSFVCDELAWGIRETLRASGQEELSLLGWCIGGTLVAMHAAIEERSPARNLVLLTTPVDTSGSLYGSWVARDSFDVDLVAEVLPSIPGAGIDWANKLMKPVTNWWTTYRQLWERVLAGDGRREAYQPMARWVADNPPFPGRAYREWIT